MICKILNVKSFSFIMRNVDTNLSVEEKDKPLGSFILKLQTFKWL